MFGIFIKSNNLILAFIRMVEQPRKKKTYGLAFEYDLFSILRIALVVKNYICNTRRVADSQQSAGLSSHTTWVIKDNVSHALFLLHCQI